MFLGGDPFEGIRAEHHTLGLLSILLRLMGMLFGLFGLFSLFSWTKETKWTKQTRWTKRTNKGDSNRCAIGFRSQNWEMFRDCLQNHRIFMRPRGKRRAQNMSCTVSAESILIPIECNWIQMDVGAEPSWLASLHSSVSFNIGFRHLSYWGSSSCGLRPVRPAKPAGITCCIWKRPRKEAGVKFHFSKHVQEELETRKIARALVD